MKGVELMEKGATPEKILQAMMADEFQPGEQPQDGVIFKLAVQGIEQGGNPAVTLLNEQFDFLQSYK
jgi:hypothetical protein